MASGHVDAIMHGRVLISNNNWLADAAKQLHDHDFQVYNHLYQRGQVR
ncbi:hypothetical protein [Eremococcus coleocola]|uniref:Uncharacterized protein n=1 Tax=Eremococcus coleocola ACS-139-V-Col8 TaxID=908337 RepID=E4KQ03_9LACT|nr:hypothetical protein [Eremococcus coleocola]EFR31238.1 hypothetical protein HMPREF9257_1642 [Eremococcus coleocola ACS-139-V-Col8]